MQRLFSLSLLFLIVISVSGLALADGLNDKVNSADYLTNPSAFESQIVEVKARVIAIHANSKSMELFDSNSKKMVVVKLGQLSKAERNTLIRSDVRQVAVTGRANMIGGKLTIDAHSVQILTEQDQTVR